MNAISAQPLLTVLASFVHWSIRDADGHLDPQFPWPFQFAGLRHRFTGYTWARSSHHHRALIWAIVPLSCRWPTQLKDIEPAIYRPDTYTQGFNGLPSDDLDHYLILELIDPRTVRACLAMHIERRDWYLLDEHLLEVT